MFMASTVTEKKTLLDEMLQVAEENKELFKALQYEDSSLLGE
jgi:hypothetical protein